MIIIPTGTDAPIYHWPRATVAMIVLNVAAFVAVPPPSDRRFDDDDEVVEAAVSNFDRYALTLGDGLHPVQWVTHNFLHNDVFHLIGNLVFLWAFGHRGRGEARDGQVPVDLPRHRHPPRGAHADALAPLGAARAARPGRRPSSSGCWRSAWSGRPGTS